MAGIEYEYRYTTNKPKGEKQMLLIRQLEKLADTLYPNTKDYKLMQGYFPDLIGTNHGRESNLSEVAQRIIVLKTHHKELLAMAKQMEKEGNNET